MRSACNMSDIIASECREGMVNVNHCLCSLESLKSTVKQSSFTSNNVLDAVYALTRKKSLEMLSPLAVEVVRYGEMMRIYVSELSTDFRFSCLDCNWNLPLNPLPSLPRAHMSVRRVEPAT